MLPAQPLFNSSCVTVADAEQALRARAIALRRFLANFRRGEQNLRVPEQLAGQECTGGVLFRIIACGSLLVGEPFLNCELLFGTFVNHKIWMAIIIVVIVSI